MKSGIWVLDHDTGYKNIKKDLIERCGRETVQRIWEKAGRNWEELCARYAHLPEKMKQHMKPGESKLMMLAGSTLLVGRK